MSENKKLGREMAKRIAIQREENKKQRRRQDINNKIKAAKSEFHRKIEFAKSDSVDIMIESEYNNLDFDLYCKTKYRRKKEHYKCSFLLSSRHQDNNMTNMDNE